MNNLEDTDARPPWDHLPGENSLWFGRFKKWLQQPQPRSLLSIYNSERARKGKRSDATTYPHAWGNAKERFHWVARTAAFDTAEQQRKDCEWETMREQERCTELAIAEALRKKAFTLLSLPVQVEKEIRDRNGTPVEYRLMVEFRAFAVAAQLFAEARAHARLGLEMPSTFAHHELTGRDRGALRVEHVGESEAVRLAKLLELARRATGTDERLLVLPFIPAIAAQTWEYRGGGGKNDGKDSRGNRRVTEQSFVIAFLSP